MLKGEIQPRHEVIKGVSLYSFPVGYPPALCYPIPNPGDEYALVKLLAKEYDVDLVHIYQPEFLTSVIACLACRSLGTPYMITVNDLPGVSWFYGRALVDLVGHLYTIGAGMQIIRGANHVLTYSSQVRELLTRWGIDKSRVTWLPEGVDATLFRPDPETRDKIRNQLGFMPSDRVIVYTGRLVPVKGLDVLLAATKDVMRSEPSVRLLIIGDGPLRGLCMKMAKQFSNNIFYLGLRPHRDMPALLSASDAFVLPSRGEGISSSLLEASAAGLPVVATYVGANKDIVTSQTGILVPPGDRERLTRAIAYLVSNPEMAKRLGKNGRERVKRCFSWHSVVTKYENLCRLLVDNNPLEWTTRGGDPRDC